MRKHRLLLVAVISVILFLVQLACETSDLEKVIDVSGTQDGNIFVEATETPPTAQPDETNVSRPPDATLQAPVESFFVYFTDPEASGADGRSGGVDEVLVEAIDGAQESIDLAIYNMSLKKVGEALIQAAQRGVKVRVVMESEALDRDVPQRLVDSGMIEVLGDRREGLMHNKYMVIDGLTVWTGSLNYTVTGVYEDNNNLVRIDDEALAQDYSADFEAMFTDDQFGVEKAGAAPYPELLIDERPVRVFFSPGGGADRALVGLVKQAQSSVHFLAYNLTANDLGKALVEANQSGVDVRGVMDAETARNSTGSEYEMLHKAKIAVLDANKGLMHHKVIIVDQRWVVLGSYNFTASAEKSNNENLLILDNPGLAAKFEDEFEKLYTQATQ